MFFYGLHIVRGLQIHSSRNVMVPKLHGANLDAAAVRGNYGEGELLLLQQLRCRYDVRVGVVAETAIQIVMLQQLP